MPPKPSRPNLPENAMTTDQPSLPEIIAKVEHGVVQINTSKGCGSGFVASPAGYVITNAHVVADSRNTIWEGRAVTVRFFDNLDVKGIVIAHGIRSESDSVDLACIQVDHIPFSTPLRLRNSSQVKQGDDAIVIGYPVPNETADQMTVAKGIISAVNPTEFQHDAAQNPGNSGGPLLDNQGNVIGVCTRGIDYTADNRPVDGISFAITSNIVMRLFPFLTKTVEAQPEHPEPAMSQQHSPAAVSGHIILNGRFSIVPPHRWELTPGPQANFARFQSPHSVLSLSLSDLESNLQTFADLQRQTLQTQATTWQSGNVDKLIPGNNSEYPSFHFDCQGDFGDGKGVFQSRHYFSFVAGENGKRQVLSATLTTADGSPDHKAGLRLVLSNFLSKLQPGPAA